MNKKLLLCGLASMAALSFVACEDDDDNNNAGEKNEKKETLTGSFLSSSDCKGSGLRSGDALGKDTILTYDFDLEKKTGTITIVNYTDECETTHSAEISVQGNAITIMPTTKYPIYITEDGDTIELHANCICRYDITSQFTGIEAKEYEITFGKLEGQSFNIDLSKSTSGVIIKE